MSCKNNNHIIGCGRDGKCTIDEYVESGLIHPGELFKFCPDCGDRLFFLDDMADKYLLDAKIDVPNAQAANHLATKYQPTLLAALACIGQLGTNIQAEKKP